MHILIAADSFKDALDAPQVCEALAAGLRAAHPGATLALCPLADGGEGTLALLTEALRLRSVTVAACDALQRPIMAAYSLSADGRTAYLEMARTAGLPMLQPHERDPLATSSAGVGMQVQDALDRGARRMVMAIGGSATHDVGIGMAAALGWQFLDAAGQPVLPVGGLLGHIQHIRAPLRPIRCEVEVMCDVRNPLFGPAGAAQVYAAQKGADVESIARLEAGTKHFAAVAQRSLPSAPDPQAPGAGAAGGMGYGAQLFLGAQLRPGTAVVLEALGLREQLRKADLLVTGEGSIDGQTAHGKLIQGLCALAAEEGVPVVAFCGRLAATAAEISAIGLRQAYDINAGHPPQPLPELLRQTADRLRQAAQRADLGLGPAR